MNQVHQWLVKQGRLGISAVDRFVAIEVDAQGGPDCVLTPQDAEEVAAIIALRAQELWDSTDASAPYEPSFEDHGPAGYRWLTAGGSLTIQRMAAEPDVRLQYAGTQPCLLTVGQAVELIQLLQHLVRPEGAAEAATPAPAAPAPELTPEPAPEPVPEPPPSLPAPEPAEPAPVARKPWWKFW